MFCSLDKLQNKMFKFIYIIGGFTLGLYSPFFKKISSLFPFALGPNKEKL